MTDALIDHDARRTADLAMQQIKMHVKHCDSAAKRHAIAQEAQLKSLSRVHDRIDRMIWMAVLGMGSILLGVVGILFKMLADGKV